MATHHVIIGGGPAAVNAIETIRQVETGTSRITLVSDEPPHARMTLPYWLAGTITREHTQTSDADTFRRLDVETRIPVRASHLNPQAKTVLLSDGSRLEFDQLLIATGASPMETPIPGADLPNVQPLWTLGHTEQVLSTVDGLPQPRVVLVGAGFIGFILLGAMFKRGWKMTVAEREDQVLPRMLDHGAAQQVQSWLAERGIDVHTKTSAQEIGQDDGRTTRVQLTSGCRVDADLVIIATGIQPNLQLTEGSGITVDQGILVNDRMQTNVPHIYAAGDVAQGPVLGSDETAIHAIQPTAVDHGRVAGANMAGGQVHYPGSLAMNVVDVCGLQCASFGNWNDPDAESTTVDNAAGYVYRKYMWREDQLVGAIFAGRANDMGMLTDVGMVKGILQTQTRLGPWRQHLIENPFDIRRAYIARGVAQKLTETTLIGQPASQRAYRFGNASPQRKPGPAHSLFVDTKEP